MNNVPDMDTLFAHRISFMDDYDDEEDIIRELKKLLTENGLDEEEINESLKKFYRHFNINISDDIIDSIEIEDEQNEPVNVNQPFSLFSNLLNIFGRRNAIVQEQEMATEGLTYTPFDINSFFIGTNTFQQSSIPVVMPLPSHFIRNNTHMEMVNTITSLFNPTVGSELRNNNIFRDVETVTNKESFDQLKTWTLESDYETDCVVCMGKQLKDEKVTELDCKHVFHTECIETYLRNYNNKCPICRKETGDSEFINM
jgi:hypothetical protein